MRMQMDFNIDEAINALVKFGADYLKTDLYMICNLAEKIDPLSFMGPFTVPFMYDEYEIYDADFEILWTRVCKRNPVLIYLLLRDVQMGKTTREELTESLFADSEVIFDFPAMYAAMKERLPEFDVENRFDANSIGKLMSNEAPTTPASAVARWWADTLRGSGKSDAKLDYSGPAAMLMGLGAGMKKVDSEEQIQKFEDALTAIIDKALVEGRRPIYHKWKSKYEPRSKKKRILKKFYKQRYPNRDCIGRMEIPSYEKLVTGYYNRPVSFGVDYHPERELKDACSIAGIRCDMMTFPFKTHCRVEKEWSGVANGYGESLQVIFGEMPKQGMRRS